VADRFGATAVIQKSAAPKLASEKRHNLKRFWHTASCESRRKEDYGEVQRCEDAKGPQLAEGEASGEGAHYAQDGGYRCRAEGSVPDGAAPEAQPSCSISEEAFALSEHRPGAGKGSRAIRTA
jgi:hypothetical protein